MAQHLNHVSPLRSGSRERVERWLDSIDPSPPPSHDSRNSPPLPDHESSGGDGDRHNGEETTLALRGGVGSCDCDAQDERCLVLGRLEDIRSFKTTETDVPIRVPEQVCYGRHRARPTEVFRSFANFEVDCRVATERRSDTVVSEATDEGLKEDQPVPQACAQPPDSPGRTGTLCVEPELLCATNDALDLTLEASEGPSITSVLDEVDRGMVTEQNGSVAQAENHHPNEYRLSTISPGLHYDSYSLHDEPSDISRHSSDTLCPSIASAESTPTLINVAAPRRATIRIHGSVDLSHGDIWDPYAC